MPLDRGAHAKGRSWFWASRLLGVFVIIAVIVLLIGKVLVAFNLFVLGLIPALALSLRRGLAVDPHDVGTHETVDTYVLRNEADTTQRIVARIGMVPAQIGDFILTFVWRQTRNFIDKRFK